MVTGAERPVRMGHRWTQRLGAWYLIASAAGALALVVAPRTHPLGGWWGSAEVQLSLLTVLVGACAALAVILVWVGWRHGIPELGLLGTALAVLALFSVVHCLAAPGVLRSSPNLSSVAGVLALPAGVAAGAPMLAPGAPASRWIARRWRTWTIAWLLATVAALSAGWFAPARWLPGPGSALQGPAVAVGVTGAAVLAGRHLRLYRIGRHRSSLVAAVGVGYLAVVTLLESSLVVSSPAWWIARGLDLGSVLAVAVAGLVLSRSQRRVTEVLAPVVSRDPLSALEVGLTPEIHAFVAALSDKDRPTRDHVVRVGDLATRTAVRARLPARRVRDTGLAALLHDLGKLVVPSAILTKTGALSDEELAEIKTHPARGAALLRSSGILSSAADLVRWHHERYDGLGYPDRLAGEQIPLEAALVAVCDAWDAMTNDRYYRAGMGEERARAVLLDGAGTQWHPRAVQLALEEIGSGKASNAFAGVGEDVRPIAAEVESVCADALGGPPPSPEPDTHADEELRRSQDRFRTVFEHAPIGMMLVGPAGDVCRANRALEALLGEGRSLPGVDALGLVASEDRRRARQLWARLQREPHGAHRTDVRLQRADGRAVPVEVVTTAVEDDDGSRCYLVQVVDLTERLAHEQKLRQLTLTDQLTGLCNRRGLLATGEEVLQAARRDHRHLVGVVVDLDGLKAINDGYGHVLGDQAIMDVATVLREVFSSAEVIARLGGDEFFVLSSSEGLDDGTVRSMLEEALSNHTSGLERPYPLSVSVGMVRSVEGAETLIDVIDGADRAMYAHRGRRMSLADGATWTPTSLHFLGQKFDGGGEAELSDLRSSP